MHKFNNSLNRYIYKQLRREEMKEAVKEGMKVIGGAIAFIFTMYAFAVLMYVIS